MATSSLYESTAILRYLDRAFPGRSCGRTILVAARSATSGRAPSADSLVNAALRYMASRFGFLPVPAEMEQQYLDKTRELVPIFDRQLGRHRFLAGDAVTVADLYPRIRSRLLPRHRRAQGDRRQAPNSRWARDMAARPSAVATEPSTSRSSPPEFVVGHHLMDTIQGMHR